MKIELDSQETQDLLTSLLLARRCFGDGSRRSTTQLARIDALMDKVETAKGEVYSSSCDMEVGPCACGAWHGSGTIKARNTESPKCSTELIPVDGIVEVPSKDNSGGMPDVTYHVWVRSQDSFEYSGEYDNLSSAQWAWARDSQTFGRTVKPKAARVFMLTPHGKYAEISNPREKV